jgi:hypothetical protein
MILGINREEREFMEVAKDGAIDARDGDTDEDNGSADAEDRTVGTDRVFERNEGDLEERVLV